MEAETRTALIAKLISVMNDIDHVEKTGRNEKQNYAYMKATDLAHAVRKKLADRNVLMSIDLAELERWTVPTHSGGTMNYCRVAAQYTFYDGESGQQLGPFTSIGWGSDTGDKAPYKATTGAIKYALRAQFLVPDDSDPENDKNEIKEESRFGKVPKKPSAVADVKPSTGIQGIDKGGYGKPTDFNFGASNPSPKTDVEAPRMPQDARQGVETSSATVGQKPKITEAQRKRLFSILSGSKRKESELKEFLLTVKTPDSPNGITSSKDIPKSLYETVCAWVSGDAFDAVKEAVK